MSSPPPMPDIQIVVFDFNGTIVDTVRSTQQVLEQLQLQFQDTTGSDRTFPYLDRVPFPEPSFLQTTHLYPHQIPQLIHKIKQDLTKKTEKLIPNPDIGYVVRELAGTELSLGVLTSAPASNVLHFINQQEFGECLDFLYSRVPIWGKPKVLSALLKNASLPGESLLYVTSDITNIKAVGASQVQIAAGTWGFSKRAELETYHPTYIIDSPKEVLPIIGQPVGNQEVDGEMEK